MTCAYDSIGERSHLLKTSSLVHFDRSIENHGRRSTIHLPLFFVLFRVSTSCSFLEDVPIKVATRISLRTYVILFWNYHAKCTCVARTCRLVEVLDVFGRQNRACLPFWKVEMVSFHDAHRSPSNGVVCILIELASKGQQEEDSTYLSIERGALIDPVAT